MPDTKDLLIVFDLVSTLTDAGPRYVHAFIDVCKKYDYPVPDEDEVLDMLGNKNLKEIIAHFIGPLDDEKRGQFMGSCNNTCDAMLFAEDWNESLFPNVKETLEMLHSAGYPLGIYTGTRENALDDQINYHGIAHLFDPNYLRGKDNERDAGLSTKEIKAQQLHSLVEQHRIDCKKDAVSVLVVGDSAADAESASEHGYLFIGFAENERKKEKLLQSDVKFLITDFADLPYLLQIATTPVGPVDDKCRGAMKKEPPETLKAMRKCLNKLLVRGL
ncbi:MAG: HAD family hydrolase [Gammaproteobacteria bacterium]|nr:HAD family hydrolase [Gammaproteobacteria bacterium]